MLGKLRDRWALKRSFLTRSMLQHLRSSRVASPIQVLSVYFIARRLSRFLHTSYYWDIVFLSADECNIVLS